VNYTLVGLSIGLGFVIRLFFTMIRYRTSNETSGPVKIQVPDEERLLHESQKTFVYNLPTSPISYAPVNYLSVSEFLTLGGTMPNFIKWGKYFIFRLFPPTIIFILLAGIISKYYPSESLIVYLLVCAISFSFLMDFMGLLQTEIMSVKIVFVGNIIATLCTALAIGILATYLDFSEVAPNLNGLFTNLWSSLLAAILIVFYMQTTNFNSAKNKIINEQKKENTLNNFIIDSYNSINLKYDKSIQQFCSENKTARSLMYAVLIYENMNRPAFMRFIENLIVRVFHIELTVGVAQVKSKRPLSDVASIEAGAKLLNNTEGNFWDVYNYPFVDLQKDLKKYNESNSYPEQIYKIMQHLARYQQHLFTDEVTK